MTYLQNGSFTPDTSAIAKMLVDALLPTNDGIKSSPFLDVFLRTTDGQSFGANRMILSLRCPYFKNLALAAGDAQGPTLLPTVKLSMDSATLTNVLTYVYSGDIPLVVETLDQLKNKGSPDLSSSKLSALVDLATAASAMKLRGLRDTAASTLMEVFDSVPTLACSVLELAVRHRNGVLLDFPLTETWNTMLDDMEKFFGIPDVRECRNEEMQCTWNEAAIHALSTTTMEHLMADAMPSEWNRAEMGTKLFQALHVWGTGGKLPPKNPGLVQTTGMGMLAPSGEEQATQTLVDLKNGHDHQGSRLALAKDIISKLDFVSFSHSFISRFVEGSPLLMPNALLEAYKSIAADSSAGLESHKAVAKKATARIESLETQLKERESTIRKMRSSNCGINDYYNLIDALNGSYPNGQDCSYCEAVQNIISKYE